MDEELEPEALTLTQDADLDTATEETEESIEDVRAKLAKAEEIATNQRIRAEKAERERKSNTTSQTNTQQPAAATGIDHNDIYALMDAKVPQEDVSDVADYAKFKGITLQEALKSSAVKSILKDKAELRNTAAATSTGKVSRGTARASDDSLLGNAQKGNLPESDDDLVRLVKARKGIK